MKKTSILAKFIWLGITALVALLFCKLFFRNTPYSQVFMFTHIVVITIMTQLVLGIAAFIAKVEEPFIELLKFLVFTVSSFLLTILISTIISAIFKLPLSYSYIIIVILFQFLPDYKPKKKPNKE